MKVLIIPSAYPNKYNTLRATFYRDHALALKSVGNEVVVLAVIPISLKSIILTKRIRLGFSYLDDEGIKTYLFEYLSIPKLRSLNNIIRTQIGKKIYKNICLGWNKPDIVHVHSFLAGELAIWIKRKYNIKYVLTEHSSGIVRELFKYSQKSLIYRSFKNASVCTAVSLLFVEELSKRYKIPFVYTPNAIDFTFYNNKKKPIKKSKEVIRICNVAFITEIKKQDRLIESIIRVVTLYPNIELHIAGDGPERINLEKIVETYNISKKIIFHGILNRKRVVELMKSCDIFALSSDYETFGVVVIEALACGLPVISTKCGGPESIITDQKLGLLTEKDVDSFTEGLLCIIRKYKEGYFDSNYINSAAREKYSFESVGIKMTSIYNEVLEDKHDINP